jgi:hypothetical protein
MLGYGTLESMSVNGILDLSEDANGICRALNHTMTYFPIRSRYINCLNCQMSLSHYFLVACGVNQDGGICSQVLRLVLRSDPGVHSFSTIAD